MRVRVYVGVHVCTCVCIYIFTFSCMRTWVYAQTVYTCVYLTKKQKPTPQRKIMPIFIHTCMQHSTRMHWYKCVYINAYVWKIHITRQTWRSSTPATIYTSLLSLKLFSTNSAVGQETRTLPSVSSKTPSWVVGFSTSQLHIHCTSNFAACIVVRIPLVSIFSSTSSWVAGTESSNSQ